MVPGGSYRGTYLQVVLAGKNAAPGGSYRWQVVLVGKKLYSQLEFFFCAPTAPLFFVGRSHTDACSFELIAAALNPFSLCTHTLMRAYVR